MVHRGIWFGILVAAILTLGATIAPGFYSTAILGSGFLAQLLCSGTFVSHRDPQAIVTEDMSGPGYELLSFFQWQVERNRKRATASMFGLGHRVAIFREGLGCTLIVDTTEDDLRAQAGGGFPAPSASDPEALWPEGERVDLQAPPQDIDRVALGAAVEAAFAEPDPIHPRRTRALVVVHGGRIVAERYAPGFDAMMPLIGWSMAKMAMNALVGIAVRNGKLALTEKALLPEWRGDGDARRDITLDQLLRMTSGLIFNEDYEDYSSDAIQMLFVKGDKAGFAASKPLQYSPGSHWSYSGGASNIIARILRQRFADVRDYLRFPREQLFQPLGMSSAVLEPDEAGTFVGSSFMYASARDWARLGLLYLNDGVWRGRRLLPEGWISYSLTPTQKAQDARYGAHVWLKLPQSPSLGEPPLPDDAYYMLGHDQQIVAVVPSRDLVIVRLGLARDERAWDHARDLAPIIKAVPHRPVNLGSDVDIASRFVDVRFTP
jgi:CubicO group peptidase (beta-lactamase class C family)